MRKSQSFPSYKSFPLNVGNLPVPLSRKFYFCYFNSQLLHFRDIFCLCLYPFGKNKLIRASATFFFEKILVFYRILGSGFTGNNCEVDVDECDAFPCEHGFCSNLPGDYKCHCFPGFEVGQSIFNNRGGKVEP